MQDAKTYRQYAEECRRLAASMPTHRAKLLDMAAVWTNLAAKAETNNREEPT
jgi:ferric-dicitrate binding protein FerR (iron transport regulator)